MSQIIEFIAIEKHDGDLLPCPFCGEKPTLGALGDGRFTIKCYNCGIIMIQDRRDKLKSLWNRRQ